jgi:hypothetical protein
MLPGGCWVFAGPRISCNAQGQPRGAAALHQPGDLVPVEAVGIGLGSCARLGLHTPGGDRVAQCGVVAFGLAGVGLGEVRHGLVELV